MRPAGATNTKWSIADVDRIARGYASGLSIEQICELLKGTKQESTIEEIRELLRQVRK